MPKIMELIENWGQENTGGASGRPKTVFTLGVFDGLHLGHRSLVDALVKSAAHLKAQSLLLTFDPHPLEILAKNAAPPRLSTTAEKAEILAGWGLDRLGVLRFDRDMAALLPVKFLDRFLGKFIDPVLAVLGPDFSFGRDAAGDAETVAQWLKGFSPRAQVRGIAPQSGADGQFSSSQLRQAIKSGLVEIAARIMGRPYQLRGVVEHGQARGRNLGFPTANLGAGGQLLPAPGVYAVWVSMDGRARPGMASIGDKPTFGERAMTVEANIFDFHEFIYGREIAIGFVARLRDMIKFASAEDLARQLDLDKNAAMRALGENAA